MNSCLSIDLNGSNLSFEEVELCVLEWADEKGIVTETPEQALVQIGKMEEEVAELKASLLKPSQLVTFNAPYDEVDTEFYNSELELGDVLVTVIVTAACAGLDPTQALRRAYAKIRDRKGKTVNGVFVKD